MDVSIITVNWNSKVYLAKAIGSVEASLRGIEFEIVVIDSGSYDGCGEMLAEQYPRVRFLQGTRNVGFAAANNTALRYTSGEILLFLNPDTEVVGTAIQDLYQAFQRLPDAGIVGPKLLNTDGTVQETCIRAFPTLLNQFLDSDLLRTRFPRSFLWGKRHLLSARDGSPEPVDAVSGASLMIRRSLFERVGMFTTDYFMYAEDMDLCLKCGREGFTVYYVPAAVVVHHGGGSSSVSPVSKFSAVMRLESQWRFFRRTRSPAYAGLYRMAMFVASLIRIGLLLLAWPVQTLRRRNVGHWNAVLKWTARLRWTIGAERWVRDY